MGHVCGRKHFIRPLTGRFPDVAARIDRYARVLFHCEVGVFARATRDQPSKPLLALLHEEVTSNEHEILAQIGREKPLPEFLQDLRQEVA